MSRTQGPPTTSILPRPARRTQRQSFQVAVNSRRAHERRSTRHNSAAPPPLAVRKLQATYVDKSRCSSHAHRWRICIAVLCMLALAAAGAVGAPCCCCTAKRPCSFRRRICRCVIRLHRAAAAAAGTAAVHHCQLSGKHGALVLPAQAALYALLLAQHALHKLQQGHGRMCDGRHNHRLHGVAKTAGHASQHLGLGGVL